MIPSVTSLPNLSRHCFVIFFVACGCSGATLSTAESPRNSALNEDDGSTSNAAVTVYGSMDLPRTASTRGLSSTYFDLAARTLYAIQDKTPAITPLVASDDYKTWTPGASIALVDRPVPGWDGEGLTFIDGKFYAVTIESAAQVETFDKAGAFIGMVDMPAVYSKSRVSNKGLESLTASPDGKYLFTVNEQSLQCDGEGPTKSRGTIARILRRELATGHDVEFAYRTEALGPGTGGDMGIAELAALSDDELLVLERGFQPDYGNTVRIYKASLNGAADVNSVLALGDDTPVVKKKLVVDLVNLPSIGFTNPGVQKNPLLDNYECLSLGPKLQDGRQLLFLTSDDNGSAKQVPRVLVLAM